MKKGVKIFNKKSNSRFDLLINKKNYVKSKPRKSSLKFGFSGPRNFTISRRSQIWVETVIYTLIGLAIIGILLSIVNPAIKKRQDKILIETSKEMLSNIENTIEEVRYYGVGNSRLIEIQIKKGKLEFDSLNDKIGFSIETNYEYSEPGQIIESGNIEILTNKKAENYDVFLTLNYNGILNLTWNEKEISKTFQQTPTQHLVWATNRGKEGMFTNIDFS